jgi:hypothetical protein
MSVGVGQLSSAFSAAAAEAASVCLADRGHSTPTPMQLQGEVPAVATLHWSQPSGQAVRTWADQEVATEQAAYAVAALLVSEMSELEIVERSRKGTGFDFWLGEKGSTTGLFQAKARLEVSGIRSGTRNDVAERVRRKNAQTERSAGALAAIVVVVELGGPLSWIAINSRR